MVSRLQNWIARRIALGGFSRRRDVLRFAVYRTFWTTLAAVGLNFGVYQLFGRLGIFGISMPPDPVADIIVTGFVAGPICFLAYYVVGSAILKLAISRDAFERLSRIDPLTGLLNRRAFVEIIEAIGKPYILVLLDIDRFKSINDNHGHGTGDEILVAVAGMFRDMPGTDAVARLGGEEFAVVLTGLTKAEAMDKINGLRQHLAARLFRFSGEEVHVTFSAGLAQGGHDTGYSTALSRADKALYLAKAAGRNRVVHADEVAGLFAANEDFPERRAI